MPFNRGFSKGVKKNSLDFLEIENIFVNKKGANYKLMAKSQFLLNPPKFERIFLNIIRTRHIHFK